MTIMESSPIREQIAAIADEYVEQAKYDYVGLWQICIRVKQEFRTVVLERIQSIVLKIVEELLVRGLEAVDLPPSGSGCIPWTNQDSVSVISRISSEWNALGRELTVNEIAWFNNPATQAATSSDR